MLVEEKLVVLQYMELWRWKAVEVSDLS